MSTLFRFISSDVCRKNMAITLPIRLMSNYKTKPRLKLHSYLLTRYVDFVKKYESILEKRFPAAARLYQVFKIGIKDFKNDVFLLFQIYKKVNLQGFKALTSKELEVYFRMPKDMIRVAPVLGISVLPGGGVIFPVAYMFPRLLLTSHFWSLQQRSEFAMSDHKKRLQCYRPVFRCLQARLRSLKSLSLHKSMSGVLGLLGSGVHPTPESILECKPLFSTGPYQLQSLYSSHISSLLKLHNMHRGWRRKRRLLDRAKLIHYMDMAIIREGGVACLSQEDLKFACFFRGLNPINMSHRDIVEWLNNWLCVSKSIDEASASLILHCPLLLGYNQPSNWALLHDDRPKV